LKQIIQIYYPSRIWNCITEITFGHGSFAICAAAEKIGYFGFVARTTHGFIGFTATKGQRISFIAFSSIIGVDGLMAEEMHHHCPR